MVEPARDTAPVAFQPEPEPDEEPDLGPLPEYVIDPERATPLEPVPSPPPARSPSRGRTFAPSEPEDPLAGLGIKPRTEFPQADTGGQRETGERKRSSSPAAKPDTQRSLGEPGDEGEEVGWMQGLSSRLSAYSLDTDPPEPGEPDDADDAGRRRAPRGRRLAATRSRRGCAAPTP